MRKWKLVVCGLLLSLLFGVTAFAAELTVSEDVTLKENPKLKATKNCYVKDESGNVGSSPVISTGDEVEYLVSVQKINWGTGNTAIVKPTMSNVDTSMKKYKTLVAYAFQIKVEGKVKKGGTEYALTDLVDQSGNALFSGGDSSLREGFAGMDAAPAGSDSLASNKQWFYVKLVMPGVQAGGTNWQTMFYESTDGEWSSIGGASAVGGRAGDGYFEKVIGFNVSTNGGLSEPFAIAVGSGAASAPPAPSAPSEDGGQPSDDGGSAAPAPASSAAPAPASTSVSFGLESATATVAGGGPVTVAMTDSAQPLSAASIAEAIRAEADKRLSYKQYVKEVSLSVPLTEGQSVELTFAVPEAGPGSKVKVLHFNGAKWEEVPDVAVTGQGKVKVKFTALSPVAILVYNAAKDSPRTSDSDALQYAYAVAALSLLGFAVCRKKSIRK